MAYAETAAARLVPRNSRRFSIGQHPPGAWDRITAPGGRLSSQGSPGRRQSGEECIPGESAAQSGSVCPVIPRRDFLKQAGMAALAAAPAAAYQANSIVF